MIGWGGISNPKCVVETGYHGGSSGRVERSASIGAWLERTVGDAAVDCTVIEHVLLEELVEAVGAGCREGVGLIRLAHGGRAGRRDGGSC